MRVSLAALGKVKKALAFVEDESDEDYDDEYDEEYDEEYVSDCQSDDEYSPTCNKNGRETITAALTNEQLLLCSATLKGYSLRNKKWRTY